MKIVYQIGSVPLYGALVKAVELDEQRNWIVRQTTYQQSGGQRTHTPVGRRIPEETKISIKGTLTSDEHRHFLFTSSRLRALGGFKNIPLIVFETFNNKTIRWLYVKGSITSIQESSVYGEEESGYYLRDIAIDITLETQSWRPLLEPYWEHRALSSYSQFPTAQSGVDNLFLHLDRYDDIYQRRTFYYQEWDSSLSLLSPMMWPYLYHGNGYGEDYGPFRSLYVLPSDLAWSGQARSIYAFTDLMPTGSISIQVNNFTSTLDLEALNEQMISVGIGSLQKSDEIFVGATAPYNSFIRRVEGIAPNFRPVWTNDNLYPGALNPGLNHITLSGSGTTGKVAINVEYGAL